MSSSSSTCHSEMPPWKLELLQRKKKVMNINTIGHMTQYEMHQNAEIPNGCSSNGKSNCNNYSTITGDYSIHTMSMSSCTNTVPNPPVPDQRNDNDAIHLHSHTKQRSALSEQFTSRHGSEHTDTAQDRSNLCANINSSSLNSDHINNSTSIPTKCFTNNSVNKCVTSKIVLQKYYKLNNNNTSSDFTNNKKIADTTVNASLCDDQLSLNASSNISSENDSNNDSNWFPSKRNSLNLLVAKKFQSHCGNMVAMQEISTNDTNNYSFDDPSEELQYGPGIVSKLRCRYLSLALRQSAAKQRPSLDNLRRTTSLNNLLDEDEEDVDEVDDDSGRDSNGHPNSFDETDKNAWHGNGLNGSNHINIFSKNKLIISNGCDNKTTDITQIKRIRFNDNNHQQQINGIGKPPIAPVLNGKPNETSSRRQSQRGNDSLKRARSVEALMRYDTLAWRRDQMNDSEEYPSSNPIILDELIVTESTMVKTKTAQDITIEDKIQQARERNNTKVPKKLTSFMDETERPPPDLVKQTLLKFEASANRRPRGGLQRYGNGDVASKVATYKSKLSGDIKQPSHTAVTVTSPISPTSPIKKPIIKPRTTSPKPIVLNGTNNAKIIASTNDKTAGVDIHQIRNSLEPRTNSKPATSPTTMTTTTINNVMAYRGPRQESPTTPESPQPRSSIFDISNLTKISTESAVTAYDSPTINQLTHRTECLTISTPKARPYGSQLNGKKIDDIAQNDSDNDDASTSSSTGCTGSYDINVVSGSDSNENDSDSDDKKIVLKKKRVSKMALENISNAGLTTKFAFDSTGSSNVSNQSKSYLPVINNNNINTNVNNSHTIKQTNGSDGITLSPPEPSVRQIGIIRPLINEQKPIVPPIPPVRTVLLPTASNVNSITDTIKVSVMPSSTTIVATQSVIVSPTVPGTASVVLTNNSNTSTDGNNVVIVDCNTKPMPPLRTENLLITTTTTTNVITTTPSMASPMLSPIYQDCTNNSNGNANSIVQQKNQINKEKSIEEINGKTSSLMIQLPMKWNGGNKSSSTIITSTPIVTNQHQSNSSTPSVPQIKNRAQNDTQTNTMVFNFSNRKEVPDYIENDGLVIRRKRELPKPGESGFVVLGDLTVETSTDPEPEDTWLLGDPPSPCDVHFQNDNVIINGKSNIRQKTKEQKLKNLSIQFHERLTSTFEYPSENSFTEEINISNGESYESDLLNNGAFLGNTPIGSVPLGNYTPIKAQTFSTDYELGVTRTQNTSPNHDQPIHYKTITTNSTNGIINVACNGSITNGSPTKATKIIQKTVTATQNQQILIEFDENGQNGNDMESLQCLKPANDDQTVAWSEGASDLLF